MGYQGRKNRGKAKWKKYLRKTKNEKTQQSGPGGVRGWGETHEGTTAYGFFLQCSGKQVMGHPGKLKSCSLTYENNPCNFPC